MRARVFKQTGETKFWYVINIVAGALSKVCHACVSVQAQCFVFWQN